jgi:prepilin-type N-terminal cleavage/methylation domain-containing protein
MKKMKENKGFTLVELIVVIVILAILAAILVPALLGYIDRAKGQQIVLNGKDYRYEFIRVQLRRCNNRFVLYF